ncbi:MAG: hypothetical protein VR66_12665 [Peptococcaceae bacterium BRH_c23]|nr:MAG: hypothetical protein VR66_12665 [Peptococcaceae bacterium BRH_c23]HBW34431.1 hypothetical protein [Desulfosporosinus sp.]
MFILSFIPFAVLKAQKIMFFQTNNSFKLQLYITWLALILSLKKSLGRLSSSEQRGKTKGRVGWGKGNQ